MEWRLSLAFVEKKNPFRYSQRNGYLSLKREINKANESVGSINFKSYHLKTILLELSMQPYNGDVGHYHFVKTLFDRLYNSYQSGTLFNFFIPEQNLLEKGDEKTIEILDEVKRIGNQRASNKGLTTLQDVKTYFLAGRFLRLINGIKHNGVGSSLYSFPEIKVILRFIDKDVADSVSIEMFENNTKNCDAILPSKVSGKRQDYVQLGGEISSTDINEIRRHLKNEMERLKIHKLSQIEGSEQMDKLHQFFKDEDFNKFNFPK